MHNPRTRLDIYIYVYKTTTTCVMYVEWLWQNNAAWDCLWRSEGRSLPCDSPDDDAKGRWRLSSSLYIYVYIWNTQRQVDNTLARCAKWHQCQGRRMGRKEERPGQAGEGGEVSRYVFMSLCMYVWNLPQISIKIHRLLFIRRRVKACLTAEGRRFLLWYPFLFLSYMRHHYAAIWESPNIQE